MRIAKSTKKEKNPEKLKVARFVIERCSGVPQGKEWGNYMLAFNRLWKLYPEIEFWRDYFVPWPKPYPMYAYTGVKGKEYIKEQHTRFLLEKETQKTYNLELEPVASVTVPQKPKSLIDFLKENYGEKRS